MNQDFFSLTVLIGILTSGVRLATPYLYAALGEMLGQRSGVLNLGVEGQMLMGAFAAFYVTYVTGNLGWGVLAALLVGAIMGLAMAFVTVHLQAQQGISGIGFYLFGLGLSDLLFQKLIGTVRTVSGFPKIVLPVLGQIPFLGEIFFQHNLLVYLAYLLVPLAWFLLYKTTLGLKIRAVGENPQAADSLGVSVARVRYFTIILGGVLSALGGASLSVGLLNVFQQNMTSGMGFIAVALVYFGAWRPLGVLLGAWIFSMINALQLWMQILGVPIPSDIAIMLPYVMTILVLVFAASRTRAPAALTKPFTREG
ncbi:MAG: ABC transporter permease [Anaerolineales bacterium]